MCIPSRQSRRPPRFEACIRAAHVSNTEARRHRTKDFTTPHEPRVMQGARQACRLQQQEIGSCHVRRYHEPAAAGEQPTHNQWVETSWQCLDQVGADPMDLPKKRMIRLVSFAVRANDGKLGKPSTELQVTDLLSVIQEPLPNSPRATQRLELYVGFGRRLGAWFKDTEGC